MTDALATKGWLKDAPADFRTALLAAATTRWIDVGTTFWRAGDTGNGLLGIRHGDAGMLHAMTVPGSPFGHIFGEGFWTGEGPLLNGGSQAMTLVARTPIEAACVPARAVQALLTNHPEHWQQIGRLALIHALTATVIASDQMIANSRQRCAATLLRLADCRFEGPESGERPTIAIAQDELGAMANLTRNTTGPILRDLAATGAISVGYRMVTIVDGAALRAIVNMD